MVFNKKIVGKNEMNVITRIYKYPHKFSASIFASQAFSETPMEKSR